MGTVKINICLILVVDDICLKRCLPIPLSFLFWLILIFSLIVDLPVFQRNVRAWDPGCPACLYFVKKRRHTERVYHLKKQGVAASELPLFMELPVDKNKECQSCVKRCAYNYALVKRSKERSRLRQESRQNPTGMTVPESDTAQEKYP